MEGPVIVNSDGVEVSDRVPGNGGLQRHPLRQLTALVRNLTSQSTVLLVVSQQLATVALHLGSIRIDGPDQLRFPCGMLMNQLDLVDNLFFRIVAAGLPKSWCPELGRNQLALGSSKSVTLAR